MKTAKRIGWALVIFGFFQPIVYGFNGFKVANIMGLEGEGIASICVYAIFILAAIALFISLTSKEENVNDIGFLIPSFLLGLFLHFTNLADIERQHGVTIIVVGWIVVFGGTFIPESKKSNSYEVSAYDKTGDSVNHSTMLDRLSGKDDGSTQYWTCKKCGCSSNPLSSTTCKDCGEYK